MGFGDYVMIGILCLMGLGLAGEIPGPRDEPTAPALGESPMFLQFVEETILNSFDADAQHEILATVHKQGGINQVALRRLARCKINFDDDQFTEARSCTHSALAAYVN